MSELNTSFAEPAYIARLALKRAPFSEGVDPQLYFNGGQLENRLNLLLHLARSSNKNGVVIADQGAGKTTLLTQLQIRAGNELKICSLNTLQHNDKKACLTKCLLDLGVDQAELLTNSNLGELFRKRLLQLRKLHLTPLILIDDAHSLSEELLYSFSTWLGWQDSGHYLVQAIFASSAELALPEHVLVRTQSIDLPALTKKEMTHYLNERLTKAGYIGDSLFSEKLLRRFYKLSAGNPKKLNHLAHQYLLGQKKLGVKTKTSFSFFNQSAKWFGGLVLAALVTLLLVNQDQINRFLSPVNNTDINSDEEVILLDNEQELATVVVEPAIIQSNEQANRNELASLIEEMSRQPSSPNSISTNEEIAKTDSSVSSDKNQAALPFLAEAWVKQQSPSNYTFQLMGSWNKQDVYDFAEKYALSDNVAIFESKRNGRVWYALIYGVFATKDEAIAASNKWPAPLNTMPSWLRRFDSIHKQLKSTS